METGRKRTLFSVGLILLGFTISAVWFMGRAATSGSISLNSVGCDSITGLPNVVSVTFSGDFNNDDGGGVDFIFLRIQDGAGNINREAFQSGPVPSTGLLIVTNPFPVPPQADPLTFTIFEATSSSTASGTILGSASFNTGCPFPVPPTAVPPPSAAAPAAPVDIPAQPDSRSSVCSSIGALAGGVITVRAPNASASGIGCRLIAANGSYFRTAGEIGIQTVVDMGVIAAVDVFLASNVIFGPTEVCMRGQGSVLFLDARQAPRTAQWIPYYTIGGMTCAEIYAPGTVVLVP